MAHAASAYYVSGFTDAAILTLDRRGEQAMTLRRRGQRRDRPLHQVMMPTRLGCCTSEVTSYLGFVHSSDEYYVMALASDGSPRLVERFRRLVELSEDGGYTVRDADLEIEFGPRRRGEPLEARHIDVATALQTVLEESALGLTRWLYGRTGVENLCLAGGVALNALAS
ncbi:MAG: carbamoyltransferase N-terminal domain-containing protein [Dehalococcoidia bacterium]